MVESTADVLFEYPPFYLEILLSSPQIYLVFLLFRFAFILKHFTQLRLAWSSPSLALDWSLGSMPGINSFPTPWHPPNKSISFFSEFLSSPKDEWLPAYTSPLRIHYRLLVSVIPQQNGLNFLAHILSSLASIMKITHFLATKQELLLILGFYSHTYSFWLLFCNSKCLEKSGHYSKPLIYFYLNFISNNIFGLKNLYLWK